ITVIGCAIFNAATHQSRYYETRNGLYSSSCSPMRIITCLKLKRWLKPSWMFLAWRDRYALDTRRGARPNAQPGEGIFVIRWAGKRPNDNMSDHRFKVGQTVTYLSGSIGRTPRHVFKIMQCLPPQGGDYQYRIKSANEPHDRVAKESELERTT